MKTPSTVALITLLALASGCGHETATTPTPDPKVSGERVSFPPAAPQLSSLAVEPAAHESSSRMRLFGRLAWDEDATVRVFTPFAGRVRRVLVDAGQTVRQGAPLAEVESADFGQAQADARGAESDLRLAESNLARLRELFDHGAAARKDVEAAEADEARASSQRARALARLAAYGASADSVDGLFILRSPMSGTIVERNITPGQEIRADQMLANAPQLFSPLFVLSDPSRLWIQIDATEEELASLHPGAPFRFTTNAFPGEVFPGRLDVVSESIDPVTHTVTARGTVENPRRRLKAEMFVSVELPGPAEEGASVPSAAVFLKGDRHFVFVEVASGSFERREVRVRDEHDSSVLISSGIRPGDRVVTAGCVLLEQLLD